MKVTNGGLVRAGGVALAGLLPSTRIRAAVLAGSYATGWVVGPRGFQVVSLTGPDDEGSVLHDGIPLATSTASWTVSQLAVLAGLRALPLPRALTVTAYAALLAAVEPSLLAKVEQGTAAAAAQRAADSAPR